MRTFYSLHKNIAVKPIERKGIKPIIKGGIAIMAQSTELSISELLFDAMIDNEVLLKGSLVAFHGEAEARPWNGKFYSHEGETFVMAPYGEVLFISPPESANEDWDFSNKQEKNE